MLTSEDRPQCAFCGSVDDSGGGSLCSQRDSSAKVDSNSTDLQSRQSGRRSIGNGARKMRSRIEAIIATSGEQRGTFSGQNPPQGPHTNACTPK